MTPVAAETSACSLPAANACPDKVGNKNNVPSGCLRITSIFSLAGEHRIAQQSAGRSPNRSHPELDQGPADLQSVALACQPAIEP
jgi:hypothetical protein